MHEEHDEKRKSDRRGMSRRAADLLRMALVKEEIQKYDQLLSDIFLHKDRRAGDRRSGKDRRG